MTTDGPQFPCQEDPELFFPNSSSGVGLALAEEAKRECHRCPIKDACREEALLREGSSAAKYRYGIWGATTPAERRAIYDTRRKTAVAA
ncbi:WhiB family transcriptional regulator [Kitasatospora sp. NPDC048239]|uniref:WhiB family transcriptional regulator n=1 Tax=Kitasatospora sp. NPDC048239 TaxID=3364046 RepID=UPI00371430D9